jgi:hypothetical protein
MTNRRDWDDLPELVRRAVDDRIGTVVKAVSATSGRNSDLAATLLTSAGSLFCKGIAADSPSSFMHRNEISVSRFLPRELAPRLLWHMEKDGWLLLGFEHVPGQHADLSPKSNDLPLISAAVHAIASVPVPQDSAVNHSMADQWSRVLTPLLTADLPAAVSAWSRRNADLIAGWAAKAPQRMGGVTLIHTDLNPANFLVSDTARVIDWAWWRIGAAWIDPAFLVVRLIAAGHTPDQAEEWAAQFPGYRDASEEALTAFAASVALLWERRFAGTAVTNAALRWAEYRLMG